MDLGVEGKVAIITGGSNGIGRGAAERLSAEGALVAIVSRTQDDLDRVSAEISAASGNKVIGIAADVSNEDAIKGMVDAVVDAWGRVDILINNAGTSMGSTFEGMTNEMVAQDFALKVMGAIYCTRHALPHRLLRRRTSPRRNPSASTSPRAPTTGRCARPGARARSRPTPPPTAAG